MESELNRHTLLIIAVKLWLDNNFGLDLLSVGFLELMGALENDLLYFCHKIAFAVTFESL